MVSNLIKKSLAGKKLEKNNLWPYRSIHLTPVGNKKWKKTQKQ